MRSFLLVFFFVFLSSVIFADVTVFTPSLVDLYPSSRTVYLSEGVVKEFELRIVSRSDSSIVVDVVPDASLEPYFFVEQQESFLAGKSAVVWVFSVGIPEGVDFDGVEGQLLVDLQDGEQVVPVELVLVRGNGFFSDGNLSFLIVGVLLVVAYFLLNSKKRKKVI